uniref:Putative elongation factor Tu n=1 Tax=Trypanosoma vivax (strain Y486) TaxID=1055687 RepID=G0U488_TRYVY|nr:putative elongation factor Tu [Trypanosoma vivax Y486]
MPIEHVYEIGKDKKSVIVTGRVDQGLMKLGADAELSGFSTKKLTVKVSGIEMYHKTLEECMPGDSVGASIVGTGDTTTLTKDNVERGMVLSAPGATELFNKVRAQVYVLTKEEGGRHTAFGPHYRPQLFFRCADVTADLNFPESEKFAGELNKKYGKDAEDQKKKESELKEFEKTLVCMPGDNRDLLLTLAYPMPIEKGLKFTIREGKITVGWGVVTECVALDPKVSIEGVKRVKPVTGKPKKKK